MVNEKCRYVKIAKDGSLMKQCARIPYTCSAILSNFTKLANRYSHKIPGKCRINACNHKTNTLFVLMVS